MNEQRLIKNLARLKSFVRGSYGCGWMFDGVARMVYELAVFYRPALVIQTGYLWGKSSLVILEALSDRTAWETGDLQDKGDKYFYDFTAANVPEPLASPRLISIDPNKHRLPVAEGVKFLRETYGNFELREETSKAFFEREAEKIRAGYSGQTILGVVDGDHSEEGCRLDLENFAGMGCRVIAVDDTAWIPHIGELAEDFAHRNGYYFINHRLYNGLGILVKR